MRKLIAAIQTSLDGYNEGPNGELDWIESWANPFGLLPEIDACILGAGMYPGYAQYWDAVLDSTHSSGSVSGRVPTDEEIAYANFARRTPHFVVSNKMAQPLWTNTRVLRGLDEVQAIKLQAGNPIHAIGGAKLIRGLLECGLVDELRINTHPVLLGSGKRLFDRSDSRTTLLLEAIQTTRKGVVMMSYAVQPSAMR